MYYTFALLQELRLHPTLDALVRLSEEKPEDIITSLYSFLLNVVSVMCGEQKRDIHEFLRQVQ